MNIQRFIAPTSREAMARARRQIGDSAVILSTRQTAEGFEVMAAAEESLASIAQAAQPGMAAAAPAAPAARKEVFANTQTSVANDTEAMAMSTLSFQDYVRERMREELITASYGAEAGNQFFVVNDQATQRAIEALPQARQLADNRRALGDRQ